MANPSEAKDLNFEEISSDIMQALSQIEWQSWGAAVFCVLFGVLIASFASTFTARIISKHTSAHYTLLIRRVIYYGIIFISFLFAISTLQLNMQVLGLATILTLAIGFASQTAVTNIIAGLFLVFERPFSVGDHLEYKDIIGEVLSIDLLSVKVLTYQNTLVRIPNEMLLKDQFINTTRFPIRRLDTLIRVDLNEDLDKVRTILFELASKNSMILESPQPKLVFDEFGNDAFKFFLAVWAKKDDFFVLKNQFPIEIQKAFKNQGILLPVISVRIEK